LTRDANNLLAMLWTWQNGDVSAHEIYNGDLPKALSSIKAKAIVMPVSTDLYFPPEDNAIVGGPPGSLVRLATAALVRLATAALALVVAMLVINPLASGRPLTWTTLSPPVPAHSQPPSVGVRLFDANGAATANSDGYLEGLAKAVSYP
jgi:hypothetical protein